MTAEILSDKSVQRMKAPRAAAVAGILFAVLFSTSIVLIRINLPTDLAGDVGWAQRGHKPLQIALMLMPFADIAFLWFIAVIRDQLGEHEDQFFATVFFGASLLFIAMVCVSMAIAGGIQASASSTTGASLHQDAVIFGRAVMLQITNVYALRMAGVVMISLATIWLRTRVMPRWLAGVTYFLALVLLLVVNLNFWVTLVFPAWVFFISVLVLIRNLRKPTKLIPVNS